MEDNRIEVMKKRLTTGFIILYIPLGIGMIQMFFDEDYTNNRIGSLLMIVFMMLRFIEEGIKDIWDEQRKSALFNFFLVAIVMIFLLVRVMEYLTV